MTAHRTARAAVVVTALLAGCATPPAVTPAAGPTADRQGHVPAFARKPYEPFSRADAVAIALREWRLFGQPIDDDPPGTRPTPAPEDKPERMQGLWQRVGEYWWIGQDGTQMEGAWTGMHDENGTVFAARRDGNYAWSAAFISYVMRIAGAANRFPYSPAHSTYINQARLMSLGKSAGWAVAAEAPDAYAPQAGDLICAGRGKQAEKLRFRDLPTHKAFTSHCAIVVDVAAGSISIIGGNVDDAVSLTHVPTTPDGRLAPPGGPPVDTRYPWLTVLRVQYDQ